MFQDVSRIFKDPTQTFQVITKEQIAILLQAPDQPRYGESVAQVLWSSVLCDRPGVGNVGSSNIFEHDFGGHMDGYGNPNMSFDCQIQPSTSRPWGPILEIQNLLLLAENHFLCSDFFGFPSWKHKHNKVASHGKYCRCTVAVLYINGVINGWQLGQEYCRWQDDLILSDPPLWACQQPRQKQHCICNGISTCRPQRGPQAPGCSKSSDGQLRCRTLTRTYTAMGQY